MASISVRKGPRGTTWRVMYRDPQGNQRARHFKKHADARRFQAEVTTDIGRGTWRDPNAGRAWFMDVFNAWLESRRVEVAPATYALYESVGSNYVAGHFGEAPIGDITAADVRSWIAALSKEGVGVRTIAIARQVLGMVMERAVVDDLIPANPVWATRPPRDDRPTEQRVLLPEEVEAIATNIEPRYRALVYVLAYCGLRVGEALGLRWKRVDMLKRQLTVHEQLTELGDVALAPLKTKTSRRVVAMPAFVADELAAHAAAFGPADPEAFVFTAPGGGPVRRRNLRNRAWVRALERSGVTHCRMHDLRHFAASFAVQVGAHPKALQARLGHANITTTLDRYGHLFPGADAQIADRMDEAHRGRDVTALPRSS